MCTSEWTQIGIMHFNDIGLMKLNVQQDYIELPKSRDSLSDSKPSFYDVNWAGSLRTSKFTLIFQYKTVDGQFRIAKGVHKYDLLN